MTSLPNPVDVPFVDVATAGQLIGLGRSKAYEQARRYLDTGGAEGLPCVTFGRTIRVPTAALWRLAEMYPVRDEAPAPTADATVHHLDPSARRIRDDRTPMPAI